MSSAFSAVLVLLLALPAGQASGMTFEPHGRVMWATGEIVDGDAGRFAQAVTDATGEIVLNSSGGRVLDADLMAANIRAHRFSTAVVNRCTSACFLMFLAGSPRAVIGRAQIGVHSADIGGDESQAAMATTIYEARRARDLGATNTSIGKMVTTSPQAVTYLTDADLREMNVRFVQAPP